MYIYESEKKLFLFSEIKQLLDLEDFKKEINQSVIDIFIEKGFLNRQKETFFKYIHYKKWEKKLYLDSKMELLKY